MKFPLGVIVMLAFTRFSSAAAGDTNSPAVIENLFAPPTPIVTNAPNPAVKFNVRGYLIEGNTVLPPEKFGMLSNYTGTVDFKRIRDGLGAVQLTYRQLGFATISPTLPPQKLTNGMVRVKIVEGKLARIKVEGNHYFSSNNVMRALPSLDTNILLNTRWFQPELDRANQNQDRQIYPVISPGLEPGTSDLTLKVKDQLPLHGHLELNDKSTPDTPLLRMDAAVQYGNLWQLEHQIGFDYNFSPQSYKDDNGLGYYDDPMVASYSGFYRMPLGAAQSQREDEENLPVDFGYDEVNHRFNLPAATGRPDLIFYGSRSVSDTPVAVLPGGVIFSNTLATISQQYVYHTLTIDDNLGAKLTYPLPEFAGINSSLLLGMDYKSYEQRTFSTNQYIFDLYALDSFGNREFVTSQTISLPINNDESLYYLPLSASWVAARPDDWGGFAFNYNQNIFLSPLESSRRVFQSVASSSGAGGNFTTLTAGLTRYQNLPAGWSASLNANGQWASEALINNEQFGLGGTSGVRGYREGEVYGDNGWRVLFDLKAPPVNVGYLPTESGNIPAELRCSLFMDYGEVYFLDRPATGWPAVKEWGTGASFYLTAGEHVDARLTLAWALDDVTVIDGASANYSHVHTSAGDMIAYFSIGYQF
jgi:hemolysin activation/secretion protein